MIHEVLNTGITNAKTLQTIAEELCITRDVALSHIDAERREGFPICGTWSPNRGYFLAANADELEDYILRLKHRERAIAKAKRRIVAMKNRLYGQKTEV